MIIVICLNNDEREFTKVKMRKIRSEGCASVLSVKLQKMAAVFYLNLTDFFLFEVCQSFESRAA